jgi:TPR repeat protein
MPVAMTNAIYSLGWCMLYGVGTASDPYGAVRMLNRVAKDHGGAAYTLGVCHEEGKGVVIPDINEALKFYRKAETMGHPAAEERIQKLEKLLKNRQES